VQGLVDRVFLDIQLPTANLEDLASGPDRAHPWLAFLNLLSPHTISVTATYERVLWDVWGPDVLSKNVTDMYAQDSTTVQAALDEFEKGRSAASSRRVEVALRYYARACRGSQGEEPLPDGGGWDGIPESEFVEEREAMERAVVEFATCLEAIYLDESRHQKTVRLVTRAGCFLSDDDAAILALQGRLADAYNVRSRLVHGDTAPPYRELHNTVAFLRRCARRSLVGFLRLGGSQGRIIAGVEDAFVRHENRALVPD
jgi:hypothetical protein